MRTACSEYVIRVAFSTATVVTRTRLIVMFIRILRVLFAFLVKRRENVAFFKGNVELKVNKYQGVHFIVSLNKEAVTLCPDAYRLSMR
jgi:hypothetical protein